MTIPIPNTTASGRIAVVPLVGNIDGEEAFWLGAQLSRLLGDHLRAAGLPALPYDSVSNQVRAQKAQLPLTPDALEILRTKLKVNTCIHGRYILDETARMLALRLSVDAPGVAPSPIHASAPLNNFAEFVERVALGLIERMGATINDTVRSQVKNVRRPSSFDAFKQVANAHTAWRKGQKEIALAAVTSALSFDADYEEALTIQVAIARDADDTATAHDAFLRWSKIAEKDGRKVVAAERLLMLGHWLNDRGEWPEARKAYEDSKAIFIKENDRISVARAQNNVANLDLLAGKLHDAIGTYRRSLRVFEADQKTQHDAAMTLANLALAHKNLGQRDEALSAGEQAITLARRVGDPRLLGHCLAQRATIYDDMGQWAEAEADYNQASRLLDIANDELNRAIITAHRGILLKQQGDYDQAEKMILGALAIMDRQNNPHEQAVMWLNLADVYFANEDYDQAWEYAERAHAAFQRLQSGWLAQTEELLETLDALPEADETADQPLTEESNQPSSTNTFTPRDDFSAPAANSSGPRDSQPDADK